MWCDLPVWLILWEGWVVVVSEGRQPGDGTQFPSVRDARAWLKDNGFQLEVR